MGDEKVTVDVAATGDDETIVVAMLQEYYKETNEVVAALSRNCDDPHLRDLLQELFRPLDRAAITQSAREKYSHPSGCMVIARWLGEPAGIGAVRRIGPDPVGELKHVYVRPEFRSRRISWRIGAELISRASTDLGIVTVRADTLRDSAEVQEVLLARGFQRTGRIDGLDLPEKFEPLFVFFEKQVAR